MPDFPRSTQYCRASTTLGSSNRTAVPASLARTAPLVVLRVWNNQYGNPLDGICTPQVLTLPDASFCVSLVAAFFNSAQLAGALFGSSPAALNKSLFQYITTVERWNGMPQVLPPVWLFCMKAG